MNLIKNKDNMKKVNMEIPDDKELVFDDGELVDSKEYQTEKDRNEILDSIENDIEALYNKYRDHLCGKYGINVTFNFQGYRQNTFHCVEKSYCIKFNDKELDWND